MYNTIKKITLTFSFLFAGTAIFVSCDTTSVDDHETHSDPFGVTMIMNGIEIATQEDGETTYQDGDHLEIELGQETNVIQVRWIAEDGERFTPDPNDGYTLQWNIANEDVLEVEQHEEDGPWNFHLVGVGNGETTIALELWHYDHADFTSQPFDVHVEAVVSGMDIRDESGQSVVSVNNDEVTGSFDVTAGETIGPFTAYFHDEEGTEIDTDHDYELEWHLNGSEQASIEAVEGEPFSVIINGLTSGQAEVHFSLIKKQDDHDHDEDQNDHDEEIEVFESPDIIITIN